MRRGPLLMIVAGICFTIMLCLVKLLRAELSALEVVFWRGLVAVPLALGFARKLGGGLRVKNKRILVLRCLFGFGAMTSYFAAAKGLSVTDLTLVTRLHPLGIAVLAPLFLGQAERSGRGIWGLLVLGFVGAMVLLGPQLAGSQIESREGALWAVASLVLAVAAHLCLRALGPTDGAGTIVMWFQSSVVVLSAALLCVTTGGLPVLPAQAHWLPLAGVGLTATVGQIAMTRAYALDRAALVAGVSHVRPLWAVMADVAVFSVWPGTHTMLGGALVLCAALALVFHKE